MQAETLYIPSGALAALVADRRVMRMSLASSSGRGLISLLVKAGSVDGVAAMAGDTRFDLLFDPSCVSVLWLSENGLREEAHFEADGSIAALEELVLKPFSLPRMARWLGLSKPVAVRPPVGVSGPIFQRETILMLLRHSAVADIVFGSNGLEATLQFQVRNGYGGVDERPPQDWVGVDFTEAAADVSWFDHDGSFHLTSLATATDHESILALCADPLGHVLKEGLAQKIDAAETDLTGLMRRLRENFPNAF
jgi:hypothetical protein